MVVNVRFVAVQFAELGFADRPLLGNRYGRLGHAAVIQSNGSRAAGYCVDQPPGMRLSDAVSGSNQ